MMNFLKCIDIKVKNKYELLDINHQMLRLNIKPTFDILSYLGKIDCPEEDNSFLFDIISIYPRVNTDEEIAEDPSLKKIEWRMTLDISSICDNYIQYNRSNILNIEDGQIVYSPRTNSELDRTGIIIV